MFAADGAHAPPLNPGVRQNYLATYKLLIAVFNFTPWIAILISQ